jgi:hypothetical protein
MVPVPCQALFELFLKNSSNLFQRGATVMNSAIKPLVKTILENPWSYDWTVQGLGMLRMYLPGPDNLRLHIWDQKLAVPNVSKIHTHPWNFESFVVCGIVNNQRYEEICPSNFGGNSYWKQSLQCGIGGCVKGEPVTVRIAADPYEQYREGETYHQLADEIHYSNPADGSITLVKRTVPEGRLADMAYVYWPYTHGITGWVSAEPRKATRKEIAETCDHSLTEWLSL